jgi:phosphatidylglycerophosphate synthase
MGDGTPISRRSVPPGRAGRRPIRSRDARWAKALASYLAGHGVSPNQISVGSMLAAGLGAVALFLFPQPWSAISCLLAVQLRLLCNLLDGMVAIEHRKHTTLGFLYNELPDRVSDSLLFIALGYASGIPWIGWFAALLAALTAYIRVFGAALGFAQDFRGPMAKQQRMAILAVGCLVSLVEYLIVGTNYSLPTTCALIAAGSLLTCLTRIGAIASSLEKLD